MISFCKYVAISNLIFLTNLSMAQTFCLWCLDARNRMNENHILVHDYVYIWTYFGNYVARISLNYCSRWKLTAVFHVIKHKLPCSLVRIRIKVVFTLSKGLALSFCSWILFPCFGNWKSYLIGAVMNLNSNMSLNWVILIKEKICGAITLLYRLVCNLSNIFC